MLFLLEGSEPDNGAWEEEEEEESDPIIFSILMLLMEFATV